MQDDLALLSVAAYSYFVDDRITNQLFGPVLLSFAWPVYISIVYVARNATVESAVGFTTMVSVKVKTTSASHSSLSRFHPLHPALRPKGRLTCPALYGSRLTLQRCRHSVNYYGSNGRPCCEIFMMRERQDFHVSGSSSSLNLKIYCGIQQYRTYCFKDTLLKPFTSHHNHLNFVPIIRLFWGEI